MQLTVRVQHQNQLVMFLSKEMGSHYQKYVIVFQKFGVR